MKIKFKFKPAILKSKKTTILIIIILILAASSVGFLAFKSSAISSLDKNLISLFNTVEPVFNVEYRFLNSNSMAIKITGIKEPITESPIDGVTKKLEFPKLTNLKRELITSNNLSSVGSDVSIYYNIGDTNSNNLWDLGESIYIINRGLINDMFETTLPKDLSFFGLNSYKLKTSNNNVILEFRFNDYVEPEAEEPETEEPKTEKAPSQAPIIDMDMSMIPNTNDRIFASRNDKDRKSFYIEYVQNENSINMDKLIPLFANPPIVYNTVELKEE